MAGQTAIATGAVVLVASSDQMVAGLDQAKAKVDKWGQQAQASVKASTASLTAQMDAAWKATEARQAQSLSALSKKGDWSGVLKGAKRPDEYAQAQQKTMLESFDKATQKSTGTLGIMTNSLGGVVKGLKLGEVAAMGLQGALVALGKASVDAFANMHTAGLDYELEKWNKRNVALDESIRKQRDLDLFMANRVDASDWKEVTAGIDAATQSLLGQEQRVHQLRAAHEAYLKSIDRWIGKSTIGRTLPIFDVIHQYEERPLKAELDEAEKRRKETEEHIKKLKGAALYSLLGKEVYQPMTAALDGYLGKLNEFANRVIGNHRSIAQSTAAMIRGINNETALIGLKPGDAAVEAAKQGGENDPAKLAELRLAAETRERKQLTAGIDEQLKAMEKEILLYGFTANQVRQYELAVQGATEAELERHRNLAAQLDQLQQTTALSGPRFAEAIEAGSTAAYNLEVRARWAASDKPNDDVHKQNGEKLERIITELRGQEGMFRRLMRGFGTI